MTEREKELIEAYIPSPRDTALGDFQYYAQDLSGRIQKVEITDICPRANGETVYRVVQADTRKRVKGWRDYDGFAMSDLYDNKQDCKDETHLGYSYWERLREIQQKEIRAALAEHSDKIQCSAPLGYVSENCAGKKYITNCLQCEYNGLKEV